MEDYKDIELRLKKMQIPQWNEDIENLKTLDCKDSGYVYTIYYLQKDKRKERNQMFKRVTYDPEDNIFMFYESKEAQEPFIKLKDIEINSYTEKEFSWGIAMKF